MIMIQKTKRSSFSKTKEVKKEEKERKGREMLLLIVKYVMNCFLIYCFLSMLGF